MCKPKLLIIGSGLGGLATGVILARNGYDVTILEQGTQIGGCLQCFVRRGVKFETGMHFIGSAAPGQTLDRLLRFLGIANKVTLSSLDPDGYDIISLGGGRYRIPSGRDAFIRRLTAYFPEEHEAIVRYLDLVEQVSSASSLHSLKYDGGGNSVLNAEYQLRSIDEVMQELTCNTRLADVLVGNLPLYAGERSKTPFSTHAFITDFYNQSAYRVVGGSDAIASALAVELERLGGRILTRSRVTRIVCDETKAIGVEVNGKKCTEKDFSGNYYSKDNFLPADFVISDAHPRRTLELLDTHLIRPAFRRRIAAMPQTVGGFSVYLHFKEDAVPYMNSNFYHYEQDTPWDCEHYDADSWPKGYLYMHFCHEPQPRFARAGVILSYMQMEEMRPWMGTRVGRRGADYEAFKQMKAEKLLDRLEAQFPGIREQIAHYYTSTPLTYFDYTGTEGGSMYGIAKDIHAGAAGRVPHRTKVPNVLLTGQNINSHGMLGVLVGVVVTCSELVGGKEIFEQIKERNR